MNIIIAILLCFALLGAVDKIIGGRMGLAEEFDRGMESMGNLTLSLAGIYCIGITLVQNYQDTFASLSSTLPFDVSLVVGSLLAPDFGGYAIAVKLASDVQTGCFSGVLVASTLGCTISFIIPISLGFIPQNEVHRFMNGILMGVITIPAGLILGGLVLAMTPLSLCRALWPVLILCGLLCLAILMFPSASIKVLSGIGTGIRVLSILLFCVTAATVFIPGLELVPGGLVMESLLIALKITVAVCGSMVACKLLLRHGGGVLRRIAQKMGVNEYSVLGLLGSLATSISMLPLYQQMDPKGKIMNAAFTVSGAFVFGGQMAFIASVETTSVVTAFIITKLAAGIAAVIASAVYSAKAGKASR